jgi:cytochrome c
MVSGRNLLSSRARRCSAVALAAALVLGLPSLAMAQARRSPRVLVFSKTAGFRHSSIETGIAAIRKLGKENGFAVDATEDASVFTERGLKPYRAVVFMSTTGDVLDPQQQDAFQRYIQAGGGWVGVHSATDTEYDWPWYGRLAGAWFTSHPGNPNVRKGTFRVLDSTHVSTRGLPARWEREDEFYNYKNISTDLHVLVDIDETSYEGGTNGANHPMSWYHELDGGRAWYTNMGHTEATYAEPLFQKHLLGGIRWAMGDRDVDFTRAHPDENRFTTVVLATPLNEPVELAVLPDERVLFVERHGAVKLYAPATQSVQTIATIPVSTKYADSSQAEDGLLGLAADPGFARNGWVYMYYSPAGPTPKNVLARFTMRGNALDTASRKVILEVATQRDKCCHTGGSIAFDAHGNLYVSTGDNTNPFTTGYAPLDERPDRSPWDAQKGSANTNDLRGKILRIHPERDGSYTIPAGNLFPKGTPKARPEIYVMGNRNPYRIAVDRRTGYVYWGEVGPDAQMDSVERGPKGYDEINQARRAGNFGWPHFVGDNKAYMHVDFATGAPGTRFDPAHPANTSPNNTGLTDLPPAQKAFIWYPYDASPEFPLVGSGGRTAMAGPVFYRDDFRKAARPFPAYYDKKLFIYEWMRGWIMAVTLDGNGDYVSMERLMSSHKFSNPIDMAFGPSGDLYMLEYGTGWFQGNDDARLIRIEYAPGNRVPVVAASVDKPAGTIPLTVALSSAGTADADGDVLRYQWTIARNDGTVLGTLSGANPSFTFDRAGAYTAALTVTDAAGAHASAKVPVVAGNDPPQVDMDIVDGNHSFYFPGVPVRYAVRVTDREDGSLENGRIKADQVRVTAEYLPDGVSASSSAVAPKPSPNAGRVQVEASDCLACHRVDSKSIGPAFTAVAKKYRGDSTAAARLVRKIRVGGSGVWGNVVMPAHSQLSDAQAEQIVAYILSLGGASPTAPSLPVSGEYTPPAPRNGASQGAVVLRAAYTDRGAYGLAGATSEKALVLRAPTVTLATGELSQGVQRTKVPQAPVELSMVSRSGAYAKLAQVDLTGVSGVGVLASAPASFGAAGGVLEVRLDSATGVLQGTAEIPQVTGQSPAPAPVRVPMNAGGMHDVYFVVRNDRAAAGQLLGTLLTATFEHAGGAASGPR